MKAELDITEKEIVIIYDQLRARLVKGVKDHEHTCTKECDPPVETELLAWFESLTEKQRDYVRFIGMLHLHEFAAPLDFWTEPPLEVMPTAGEH